MAGYPWLGLCGPGFAVRGVTAPLNGLTDCDSSNGTGSPSPSPHQVGAVVRYFNMGLNYKF